MAYTYKPYPAYRYFAGKLPVLVRDKEEDERLKKEGWTDSPVKQVEEILERHGAPKDDAEKIANTVASTTNKLLQVENMTRKKDVLSVAFDLSIDLDPKLKLKEMKAELIRQAGQFRELKGATDEHSQANH